MRYGICCIVLDLENNDPPKKFQKITYKRFSSLPREEAVGILSQRILNNIDVTFHAIKYCAEKNYCYRLSSDLFPLITYDKANVSLEELPDYNKIQDLFVQIKNYIANNDVRISAHPDQFNVLASIDENVVNKTIVELNFMSRLMDSFGLSADYNSPINIHIQNSKDGSREDISRRFLNNFYKLDENCQKRLVIENDDKLAAWSVAKLLDIFNPITKIPITYDSHHFRLNNPEKMSPEEAVSGCIGTWCGYRPLFHFSNGREHPLDKAHSDYVNEIHKELFLNDVDIDYEYKLKDLTIKKFIESYPLYECYRLPTKAAN